MLLKGEYIGVAICELLAVALAFFIYLVNSDYGITLLLALIFVSNVTVFGARALLAANRRIYGRMREREGFDSFLSRALYRTASGVPYMKALDQSVEEINDAKLKRKVRLSLRRYLISASDFGFGSGEGMRIKDARWAVEETARNARAAEEQHTDMEESAQRYATFNMFISTILPSFMVFAFIGSSILSRASFSLLVFSSLLVLVVPIFYSIGNLLMWRRFFA